MNYSMPTSPFSADLSGLMDPSKLMATFKMPAMDVSRFMDMQRKNVLAFATINQVVVENLQAFAQRQSEVIRQSFAETTSLANAFTSSPTAQGNVMRQVEASKAVVDKCLASIRDAAETLAVCNTHAMDAVSDRMKINLEELRGLVDSDEPLKAGRAP